MDTTTEEVGSEAAETGVVTTAKPGTRASTTKKAASKVAQIEVMATIEARDTREATINQVGTPEMIVKEAASEAAQTGVVTSGKVGTRPAAIKETGTTPEATIMEASEAVPTWKVITGRMGTRLVTTKEVDPVAVAAVAEEVVEVAAGVEAEEGRITRTVSFQISSQSHSTQKRYHVCHGVI